MQAIIIAHRGAWQATGLPQNSMASLMAAARQGYACAELDVHLDAEGEPILSHDRYILGLDVCATTAHQLPRLANGEILPRLASVIHWLATIENNFGLYIELKSCSDTGINRKLVTASIRICKYVMDRISFISFDIDMLIQLKREMPEATAYYLGGDKSPEALMRIGMDGLNYHHGIFQKNKDLIYQSQRQGLHVGAWTVNDLATAQHLSAQGVQSITTDSEHILGMQC